MTPSLLAEYIAAAGISLLGVFILWIIVLAALGFFDKNEK